MSRCDKSEHNLVESLPDVATEQDKTSLIGALRLDETLLVASIRFAATKRDRI